MDALLFISGFCFGFAAAFALARHVMK